MVPSKQGILVCLILCFSVGLPKTQKLSGGQHREALLKKLKDGRLKHLNSTTPSPKLKGMNMTDALEREQNREISRKVLRDAKISQSIVELYSSRENWAELLSSAPISVFILGQIMIMSTQVPDQSLNPTNNKNITHMQYPDSLRATLLQVSHSGYNAFRTAHTNMEKIRSLNYNVPQYLKTANELLMTSDPELIALMLPAPLNRISEAANTSVDLASNIADSFSFAQKLIEEVIRATQSSRSVGEDKLRNVTRASNTTEEETNSTGSQFDAYKENVAYLIKLGEGFTEKEREASRKAHNTANGFCEFFRRWFPSWAQEDFTYMDVEEDSSHCIKNTTCVPKIQLKKVDKQFRFHGTAEGRRVQLEEKKRDIYQKVLRMTKQLHLAHQEKVVEKNRQYHQLLRHLNQLNLKKMSLEEAVKVLFEAQKLMADLKEHWANLVRFFGDISSLVQEATGKCKDIHTFIQTASEKIEKYRNEVTVINVIYEWTKVADHASFIVFSVARMYMQVSSDYLMDGFASLDKLMTLRPHEVEVEGDRIFHFAGNATAGIIDLVRNEHKQILDRLAKREEEVSENYGAWFRNSEDDERPSEVASEEPLPVQLSAEEKEPPNPSPTPIKPAEIETQDGSIIDIKSLLERSFDNVGLLGQLMVNSSRSPDFDIQVGDSISQFRYLKNPESYRASLVGLSHLAHHAQRTAENAMKTVTSSSVADYINTALSFLESGNAETIKAFTPALIGQIKEATDRAVGVFAKVSTEFRQLSEATEELRKASENSTTYIRRVENLQQLNNERLKMGARKERFAGDIDILNTTTIRLLASRNRCQEELNHTIAQLNEAEVMELTEERLFKLTETIDVELPIVSDHCALKDDNICEMLITANYIMNKHEYASYNSTFSDDLSGLKTVLEKGSDCNEAEHPIQNLKSAIESKSSKETTLNAIKEAVASIEKLRAAEVSLSSKWEKLELSSFPGANQVKKYASTKNYLEDTIAKVTNSLNYYFRMLEHTQRKHDAISKDIGDLDSNIDLAIKSVKFLKDNLKSIIKLRSNWLQLKSQWFTIAAVFRTISSSIQSTGSQISKLESIDIDIDAIGGVQRSLQLVKEEMDLVPDRARQYYDISARYVTGILVKFDKLVTLRPSEVSKEVDQLDQSIADAKQALNGL